MSTAHNSATINGGRRQQICLHYIIDQTKITTAVAVTIYQSQRLNINEVLIPPKAKLLVITYSVSIFLELPMM